MKTFELSIAERELMCRMLRYCMENNADCNFRGGEWYPSEQGQEQKDMRALHDKLEVRTVKKSGWIAKGQITLGDLPSRAMSPDLVLVTWEEEE